MMLLTKKEDILKAMEEDLKGASDSTINWLADSFNVSLHSESKLSRHKSCDYSNRIPLLIAELRTRTLGEAEKERNLSHLDYTMKSAKRDTETPEFRRLTKLIASIEGN